MNPKLKTQSPKPAKLVPALLIWFHQNARNLPWRRTCDPYAVWVSEIMLQQTQVKTVIPYWERWIRELPTIQAVATAKPDKIHKLWEGLGYYTRARNLQKAAKQIVKNHQGKFPKHFEDVLALPGIGRYTAGAICSITYNQPTPILDGNVIRVLTRIFGIAESPKDKKTNERLWKLAEELVHHASAFAALRRGKSRVTFQKTKPRTRTRRKDGDDTVSRFNQSLMELGALVCLPRNPQCDLCPAKKLCVAFRKNCVEQLPSLGERRPYTARRFAAFVAERDGRFLVRQRPAGVVNAHLWEFPNAEIGARLCEPPHPASQNINGRSPLWDHNRVCWESKNPRSELIRNAATQTLGASPWNIQPFCTVKHSITRYRITLEAFTVRLKGVRNEDGNAWKTAAQLQQLAFSSAHKKILNQLINSPGNSGR